MNELVELVKVNENALEIFTKEDGLEPYLKKIKAEVDKFNGDVSTKAGRAEIIKMATRIVKSKTYLDDVGKKLTDRLKEQPKLVDKERKRVREYLDSLRDSVRAPVDAWNKAELERERRIKIVIQTIFDYKNITSQTGSGELTQSIKELESIKVDSSFLGFEDEASAAKNHTLTFLRGALEIRLQKEKDDAELAELRRDKEEREAKQVEEDKKQKIIAAAEEDKKAAVIDAEKIKQAELEAQKKVDAALAIAKQEENKRLSAEKEARIAKERVITAEANAKAELKRQEDEKAAKELKRKESVKLTSKAKEETLNCILKTVACRNEDAIAIIDAIYEGKIKNVFVRY